MDEADRAQAAEERDRAIALENALRRIPAITRASMDDTTCTDCELPIEAERLRVLPGSIRCALCAHEAAQRERGFAWKR